MGQSIGLEMAGCMFLFGATTLPYRILGGLLLVVGIIPWFLPVVREAIAKGKQRDAGDASTQDASSTGEPRGRRTRS